MTARRKWFSPAQVLRRGLRGAIVASLISFPSYALAADTFQDFSASFPPLPPPTPLTLNGTATVVPGSITGEATGSMLRLTPDGQNSARGWAGLGQVPSNVGSYDRLVVEFDFRMNDPGGADGFSFAYLPVSTFGLAGSAADVAEEPNIAGALGIGFDTYNNDDATDGTDVGLGGADGSLPNSLSLHWNGARLASVSMLNPILALPNNWLENSITKHATITVTPGAGGSNVHLLVTETGTASTAQPFGVSGTFIPGLTPYDGRIGLAGRTGGEDQNEYVDNVRTTFTPTGGAPISTLVNDFNTPNPPPPPPPTALGGTPYTSAQLGSAPPGVILPTFPLPPSGGDADGHYRLTADNTQSQSNSIAFNRTFATLLPGDIIGGSFELRVENTNGGTADGMSFMLADTTLYGETGPLTSNPPVFEDPNLAGMIALGFDTYDNDEDFPAGDPSGCGGGPCSDRISNSITAHANGTQIGHQFLQNMRYIDGNWIKVDFALSVVDNGAGGLGGFLDVQMTDLTTGQTFFPFGGLPIANVPANLRVAFGARTGGEFDGQYLDNVFITHQAVIPEPSSIILVASALGLVVVGQRRKWLAKN